MKEIHANASYKVLSVSLAKGEEMPRHFASSDAFLFVREGKALLKFQDRDVTLGAGSTLLIPANEPHSLHVLDNFAANVILATEARINFIDSH